MYSKEFKKAFKHLCKNLDMIDLCRYLKLSPQKIREIKRELNIT